MIETSFPNEQPDKTLFGHLTPHWLMTEMTDLSKLTGAGELNGFNLIVTHVKHTPNQYQQIEAAANNQQSVSAPSYFP